MLPDFHLRPATTADLPALVALVNSAYRGEQSTQAWTTEAHLLTGPRTDADNLRDLLAPSEAIILTCTTAGQLCGCVYLQQQAATLYLGMLSVAPSQQGQGIGKYLLRAAEIHARQAHCSHIRITVVSVRTELLAWYERHGYRLTGATEPFPTDTRFGVPRQPLQLVVLEKALTWSIDGS